MIEIKIIRNDSPILIIVLIMVSLLTSYASQVNPIRYANAESDGLEFQEVTLFFDNFEDDKVGSLPNGWVVHWGGNQYGVSTEYSYSGSKSLMVEGKYSWSCVLARPFRSSARYIGFEAHIFITKPDRVNCPLYGCPDLIISFGCYECLGPWGDAWNNILFNHTTKEIVVEDVRTNDGYRHFRTIGKFQYYKWIDIKVILDRDQAVYHIWIDDNLLAKNVPVVESRGLNKNTYLIDRLTVGSGWSGAKIYIDDVRVFEAEPTQLTQGSQTTTKTVTSTLTRTQTATKTVTKTATKTEASTVTKTVTVGTVTSTVTVTETTTVDRTTITRTVTQTLVTTRTKTWISISTSTIVKTLSVETGPSAQGIGLSLAILLIGVVTFGYGLRRGRRP